MVSLSRSGRLLSSLVDSVDDLEAAGRDQIHVGTMSSPGFPPACFRAPTGRDVTMTAFQSFLEVTRFDKTQHLICLVKYVKKNAHSKKNANSKNRRRQTN